MSIEPSSGFHLGGSTRQRSTPLLMMMLRRGSSPAAIRTEIATAVIACDFSGGKRSTSPSGRAHEPPG